MSEDTKALTFWLSYISIACVVFGYFAATFFAKGPTALIIGLIVAGFWPVSGLIWFGAWLA